MTPNPVTYRFRDIRSQMAKICLRSQKCSTGAPFLTPHLETHQKGRRHSRDAALPSGKFHADRPHRRRGSVCGQKNTLTTSANTLYYRVLRITTESSSFIISITINIIWQPRKCIVTESKSRHGSSMIGVLPSYTSATNVGLLCNYKPH